MSVKMKARLLAIYGRLIGYSRLKGTVMKLHKACGQQNDDNAIFCIYCGERIEDDEPSFGYTPNITEMPYDPTWNQDDPTQAYDQMWNPPDVPVTNQWSQHIPPAQDSHQSTTWDVPESPQHAADPVALERLDALDAKLVDFAGVQQEVSESINTVVDRLLTVEQRLNDLSSQFEGKIARNEHEIATMKRMSDEVQEYRDGLYAKLTMPLIRDLIEIRDALGGICQRYAQDSEKAEIVSEVNVCRNMIADRLGRQSVEIISSAEGDEFLSFKHKIVGKVHTSDPNLQGRIAEVSGDSYRLGDQYLSPAMVKVYALD